MPFFLHLLMSHSSQMNAIWASSPSIECATSTVQAALNRLVEWSSKWHQSINPLKCESSFFSLDLYQSRIKSSPYILNTLLNFNSNPTFLGARIKFSTALFLLSIISYSHEKSFIADSVPSDLSSLPPKAPQRNLYVLYINLYLPHPHLCFLRLVSFLLPPTFSIASLSHYKPRSHLNL